MIGDILVLHYIARVVRKWIKKGHNSRMLKNIKLAMLDKPSENRKKFSSLGVTRQNRNNWSPKSRIFWIIAILHFGQESTHPASFQLGQTPCFLLHNLPALRFAVSLVLLLCSCDCFGWDRSAFLTQMKHVMSTCNEIATFRSCWDSICDLQIISSHLTTSPSSITRLRHAGCLRRRSIIACGMRLCFRCSSNCQGLPGHSGKHPVRGLTVIMNIQDTHLINQESSRIKARILETRPVITLT
jgi:hypothetical protein